MLKRVVIENYRSCLRTSIDLHPNLSVLIGPNGSGKTNILQAIMFLNKIAQEDIYHASLRHPISLSPRIKVVFQEGHTRVRLNASVNAHPNESNKDVVLSSRQKWLFKTQNGRSAAIEAPLAFVPHLLSGWITPHHMGRPTLLYSSEVHSYNLSVPVRIPKWTGRVLLKVSTFCRGIKYYGASQFTNPGSCPVSFEIDQESKHSSLLRLRGHTRILFDMYSAKKASSNHRYNQFLDIVGPKGIRLIDDLTFREQPTSSMEHSVRVGGKVEVRRRHKLLVIPQFRIGKQKLSPNQLSEGTFKTLALLFHLTTEDSTALLIEEPEVCVHHGLLSSILELIKTYSRQKQMILSTHSDYVLDHVNPENVYIVKFQKSIGTVARHIAETMTSKELSALRKYLEQEGNLGEYWREGGLGDRL